jgi:hypothetical protein
VYATQHVRSITPALLHYCKYTVHTVPVLRLICCFYAREFNYIRPHPQYINMPGGTAVIHVLLLADPCSLKSLTDAGQCYTDSWPRAFGISLFIALPRALSIKQTAGPRSVRYCKQYCYQDPIIQTSHYSGWSVALIYTRSPVSNTRFKSRSPTRARDITADVCFSFIRHLYHATCFIVHTWSITLPGSVSTIHLIFHVAYRPLI